jgi:hypothetical protein
MPIRLVLSIPMRRFPARRTFASSALLRVGAPKVDPKTARKIRDAADTYYEADADYMHKTPPVWLAILIVILAGSTYAAAVKKAEETKKDKQE